MRNPTVNNYTAGDGKRFWIVGLDGERHWPPLARAVGRSEWLTDERFDTAAARFKNGVELVRLLDEIFSTRPLSEWAEIFDAEPDFFWSPVQTVEDLLCDEQFLAAGGLVQVPDEHGTQMMVATPGRLRDRVCQTSIPRATIGGTHAGSARRPRLRRVSDRPSRVERSGQDRPG